MTIPQYVYTNLGSPETRQNRAGKLVREGLKRHEADVAPAYVALAPDPGG